MPSPTVPAALRVPDFVLRKLYRRGSLRETGDGRFAFTIQNTLATATITQPPIIVVNGIHYPPDRVRSRVVQLATITPENPFKFQKGSRVTLRLPGRLLRGGNRIHMTVPTKEYGEIEIYVEDKEAEFCDVPGSSREEE